MPTGNTDLSLGELFFIGPDEQKSTISGLTDFTIFDATEDIDESPVMQKFTGGEATLTTTTKFNRKLFNKYMLGKSNNWLKMHGYPMVRGRFLK